MSIKAMEKPKQQIPIESPKCPRCDSSNTKFCYYNNYSLSQPRHFCKACKRYWTRGGTLRNVPVGGKFRKNKKIKRSVPAIEPPTSSSPVATSLNPNPVLFGLPTSPNPNQVTVKAVLGFGTQPQMSGFGLGVSNPNGNYHNGSINSLFTSYSLLGSYSNSPTIASLLGASQNQQKINNKLNGDFQGLGLFGEVKEEDWQNYQGPNFRNHHLEQINPYDSTLPWNATNIGAWFDPTNLGSSVLPLI